MQELLDFSRGPLFRFTFFIMILGLARIFVLDIWAAVEAYRRAGDKSLEWRAAFTKTVQWLFPVKHAFTRRPIFSFLSIVFHIGLIVVPIFLMAHIRLWQQSIGVAWIALPDVWVDALTLVTIAAGLALFLGRVLSHNARFLSRTQDFLWPLLLIVPSITGYVCASLAVTPTAYQICMLIHILSGELIFILIPFTKVAHCVIMPLSQFILVLGWKFPARIDEDMAAAMKKRGASV